mmetsp:Transcript_11071/g.24394  ORF Transcript_11071/g.24394 Transcript_11071/m.24394 type:complete len:220 (+) Transcript_11071:574-1233(+)
MCVDLIPEIKAKGGDEDKKKTKFQEEIEKLKMLQFQNHAAEEKETKKGDKEEDSTKSTSTEGAAEVKQLVEAKDVANVEPKRPSTALQEPEQKGITSDKKRGEKQANQSLQGSTATQPNMPHPEASQQRATGNTAAISPRNAPHPPPLPANVAPATERPTDTAPAAAINIAPENNSDDAPLVSDNLLHGMIGFFAAIVVVLLRQAQSLVDELHSLGDGN